MNRLVILNFGCVFSLFIIFSIFSTRSVADPLESCEDRVNFTEPYNISDSQQCDKYYVCVGGNLTDALCLTPTRFHLVEKKCVDGKRVNCSGREDDGPQVRLNPRNCLLEEGKFMCKSGVECIDRSKVCDGEFDCYDASDEFDDCSSVCSTASCHHICVPTPPPNNSSRAMGTCLCKPGYLISAFNRSACDDIDECLSFGSCSHICENTPGSFKCSCLAGFEVGKDNNRSCTVRDNQWKLIYASKTEVGYILHSSNGRERKYRITPNDGRPVAVTYDARRNLTYWTDASSYAETIYRGSVAGGDSNIEVVVDTGLLLPEGIAYDWITGNIYFADSNASHIAVCSNNSNFCSVLVQEVIDKPRDIALHPNIGYMYWTDWGMNPAIMRAGMDGSDVTPIVFTNLKWPNGITVDFGNSRIYWVDAGQDKIESSLFDGQDRRTVLSKETKHPFGIDILGDRLFFSDWSSMDIKSVNKFTGKDPQVHMYDPLAIMNGVAVFHEANQPLLRGNPCRRNPCSHVCTISPSPTSTYKCFCPAGMVLEGDRKTCSEPDGTPKLVIAFKNTIKFMRFNSIGKDVIESITLPQVRSINAIVYDPLNHTLIFSDSGAKKIYQYSINRKKESVLIDQHLDSVTALDLDAVGENLYWVDEGKRTIEVMSFRTKARMVLTSRVDSPYDILVVPELRSLYLARMGQRGGKIYRMMLNGHSNQAVQRVGDKEPIALAYDKEFQSVIWADKMYRGIETISSDGSTSAILASHLDGPPSDVVKFENQLYWTDMFSQGLKTFIIGTPDARLIRMGQFGDPANSSSTYDSNFMAKMTIINKDNPALDELRNKHDCSTKRGSNKMGCSHICLLSGEQFGGVCRCPEGLDLDQDGKTCVKMSTCGPEQFTCSDGNCISRHYICDGIADCSHNDDEVNCNAGTCSEENFKCESNGICIPKHWVCDGERDCVDGADERSCTYIPCNEEYEFKCESTGRCIPLSWKCDHAFDCPGDDSDERGCNFSCPDGFFQCNSTQHCIMRDWVCDGDPDCGDNSDELAENCADRSCPDHQFMCNSGLCIERSLVCDGAAHCAHAEDEKVCEGVAGHSFGVIKGLEDLSDDPFLIPKTTNPDSSSSEDRGSGGTVAIVIGIIIIIILVGIFIAFVLHKRNVQPKVLVRPYVHQWNKYIQEPTRRFFTNGRGQQKLDCEQHLYDDVCPDGTATYVNHAAVVYEEVDGIGERGDGMQDPNNMVILMAEKAMSSKGQLELNAVGDKRSKKEREVVSRSLADSGCHTSERESLYEEPEDCGDHYVSYSQKDKLINL